MRPARRCSLDQRERRTGRVVPMSDELFLVSTIGLRRRSAPGRAAGLVGLDRDAAWASSRSRGSRLRLDHPGRAAARGRVRCGCGDRPLAGVGPCSGVVSHRPGVGYRHPRAKERSSCGSRRAPSRRTDSSRPEPHASGRPRTRAPNVSSSDPGFPGPIFNHPWTVNDVDALRIRWAACRWSIVARTVHPHVAFPARARARIRLTRCLCVGFRYRRRPSTSAPQPQPQ
jgi:hypothetical protein